MLFKKQIPASSTTTPWIEKEEFKYSKNKEINSFTFIISHFKYPFLLFLSFSAWFFLLFFFFPPTNSTTYPIHQEVQTKRLNDDSTPKTTTTKPVVKSCDGHVSVYVYDLPPEFNLGLLVDCKHLNVYTDMCPHVANHGLGQPVTDIGSTAAWFATHQFIAEMIFHARVENHPCRTWDPERANMFYVPFYGGLHSSSKFREANLTERDELAVRLVEYIQGQPWWQRNHGKDHFLALGRTAWDFMRTASGPDFGANSLLNLPPVQNMSVLTVERNPWKGSNQYGIPYPSYFHPSTSDEMMTWQTKMRQSKRAHLFSFIGAPRKGVEKASIRDELIRQCSKSTQCKLLECARSGASKCHKPSEVLDVMTQSEFCLQAPGDSFTRRSTFDAVVAGCIPVFFSPHTAYSQYEWYLPADRGSYSVYMEEKGGNISGKIEEELMKISRERVERMRNRVIDLIPRVTYAHPDAADVRFPDAVDVALQALASHHVQ